MTSNEDDANPAKEEFDWPPLESNPEVFGDYLHNIGLTPSFSVGEVFGFDEELLGFLPQPIYGIIVALERTNRAADVAKGTLDNTPTMDFYMKQSGSLDNACGIIACIHAILNNSASKDMVMPDSVLGRFRETTKTMTPAERCTALETNQEFKTLHKNFASQGQSAAVTSDQSKVQHHFVAFVLSTTGQLVELDGTKKGPLLIGECTDVLRGSIAEVQKLLAAGEITDKLSMMTLNAAM